MPIRNSLYALIFLIMMVTISSQHDAYNRLLIDHYIGLKWIAGICALLAAYNLTAALFRFIDYAGEASENEIDYQDDSLDYSVSLKSKSS